MDFAELMFHSLSKKLYQKEKISMTALTAGDIDVIIGSNLRKLRTSRKVSLEALGSHLGVTYQQIQKYETGKNRIAASTLYLICEHFSVDVRVLMPEPLGGERSEVLQDPFYGVASMHKVAIMDLVNVLRKT